MNILKRQHFHHVFWPLWITTVARCSNLFSNYSLASKDFARLILHFQKIMLWLPPVSFEPQWLSCQPDVPPTALPITHPLLFLHCVLLVNLTSRNFFMNLFNYQKKYLIIHSPYVNTASCRAGDVLNIGNLFLSWLFQGSLWKVRYLDKLLSSDNIWV
jgi:hypothetical protein